ncbi:MAG: DUF4115 domain-containing protein [Syntrophales bacterium]|nr:DUF4115 domain-containing protein [Syntrophales bacterium]
MSSEKPEETDVRPAEPTLDLREIRQSRGLTLRDVSSSTKISPQNLKAIEEQRFELLPEPIYARAFMDMYARVLDVDGKKILSLYEKYLKSLEPDKDKYQVLKELAVQKRHLEVWIWVTIVSGLLVLIGAFFLYQYSTSGRQAAEGLPPAGQVEDAGEPQNAPEELPAGKSGDVAIEGEGEHQGADGAPPADLSMEDSAQKPDQKIEEDTRPPIEAEQPAAGEEQPLVEDTQPEKAVGPDTTLPTEKKPYTLVIEASERTWIQIDRDGEPPFEVMLWPGERITERASERFGLIIGNAGGVDIRFQERSLGLLGEHGEVVHLTLPADE